MRQTTPVLLSEAEQSFLTEDEKQQYNAARFIDEALETPLNYMLAVSPETKAYPHLQLLSDTIVALIEHRLYEEGPGPASVRNSAGQHVHPVTGEIAKQILEIDEPPGHGKSFCVSDHLPAWYVTNFPERRVGLATYEGDFAREWGGKAQQHIIDHPEFGVQIDKKHQAQDNWQLKGHKGGMFTAGVGGPVTGKRFHLGIVDDPIKNQDEAMSKTMRARNKNWWATSFLTRQHPDGETVFIVMATRWHEDDLSGHLLASMPQKVYRLSLPALAFDTVDEEGYSFDEETGRRDPLNRRPGEPLAPAMWPKEILLDIKAAQGDLWFTAMYQGRPSISEGNKFRQFGNRWTLVDGVYTLKSTNGDIKTWNVQQCYRIAAIDTAATENTSSDYSVFAVGDITPDHRLIIRYVDRRKINSDRHQRWFVDNYLRWRPKFASVEARTYGLSLIQNIRRLGRYIVRESRMPGDKEAKAQPATEAMTDGYVFLPQEAEWLPAWISEHKRFPNDTHDDQVDATSILVDEFSKIAPWTTVKVVDSPTIEEKIDKFLAEKNQERHEHPEMGYWP